MPPPVDIADMNQSDLLWGFTDRVGHERQYHMLSVPDWAAVRRLVESKSAEFVGFESRHDRLGVGGFGAKRASVRMTMPESDADIIYNSPMGLRAQYCLGLGVERNRELLDSLIPKCVVDLREADLKLAEMSLKGADAKLCLDKDDIPNLEEIHINYAPWIECLGMSERLAETGVLAPYVNTMWIKGAWVLDGHEWRDPLKADRHEKFRKYGFG